MNAIGRRIALAVLAIAWLAVLASSPLNTRAQERENRGKLVHVQSLSRPDTRSINHVTLSADGKFIYATSWQSKAINVFSRDAKTGRFELVQTMLSPRDLDGVTCVALSPDGKFATASAFTSQTVTLFSRDTETGKLALLDTARNEEKGVKGLVWAIDLTFSSDGKFIYALDPKGAGADNAGQLVAGGGVTAFEITDNQRLRWVENNLGQNGCFNGARGVAAHANGKWLYVASAAAACVTSAQCDPKSGKTTVLQVVTDGQGEASGLDGAMTPVVSPDGKFLYVNSGRFSGDSAVTVFAIRDNGGLKFVEQHVGEQGDIKNYVGGNGLAITPDGLNLYAAGTRSSTLACFDRDPQTGKLKYRETLADDAGNGELGGAAGVAISPDSRFVYVTAEDDNALTVFERK